MNPNKVIRRLPIRMKLTIAFTLIALVPLAVTGSYGLWINRSSLESSAVAHVQHYVDLLRSDVDNLLNRTRMDLEYIERLESFARFRHEIRDERDSMVAGDLAAAIALLCESNPIYFRVRFLDEDGTELLRVVDLGDRYEVLPPRAIRTGARFYQHVTTQTPLEPYLSVPVELTHPTDPSRLVPAISFVRTSRSSTGEREGLWIADLYVERLIELLERPTQAPGGQLVFCDSQGHYLYHPAKKKIWRQLLVNRSTDNVFSDWSDDVAREILSGREGVLRGAGRDIIAYAPVWKDPSDASRGYIIYYAIPAEVVFAPSARFAKVFLAIAVITILIVLLSAYLGAVQLTRPLLALSRGARDISMGNFGHRIAVSTNDEIESLAADFNSMAERMQERDKLISEHESKLSQYAENLEEMVEARTAELRGSQMLLARSEKLAATGRLAAGLAHEINNPVGIILNRIESMLAEQNGSGAPQLEKDLSVLALHARRVAGITESLLRFARPREFERAPFDLRNACADVVDLVRPQFASRDVTLEMNLPDKPVSILGDTDAMQQVILNLLDNALDASIAGGIVGISLETDRQTATVIVEDTGPGIPAGEIEKIFDPFYSTKDVGQGSGLGLTISHELVRSHDGSIRVSSSEGEGARFLVSLPIFRGSIS